MRRKGVRALSLALTTAMVLSVANPAVTVSATSADGSVIEQQVTEVSTTQATTTEVVTTEAVTEPVTEENTEAATEENTEIGKTEEVTTEAATESEKTEEATTEKATESEKTEEATTEDETESSETEETTAENTTGSSETEETTTEVATETTTEVGTTETVPETPADDQNGALIQDEEPGVDKATIDSSLYLKNVIENDTLLDMVVEICSQNGTQYSKDTMTVGQLQTYSGSLDFEPTDEQIKKVTSVKGLGVATKATSIDISKFINVKAIPADEFARCEFTVFKMPASITSIGESAFLNCTNMEEIYTGTKPNTLPEGLSSVGEEVFKDSGLVEITIPTLTDEDATGMFAECKKLTKVIFDSGVTKIPTSAFFSAGGENGIEFTFGSGLIKILNRAFEGTKLIADGEIDLSACKYLDGIAPYAFYNTQNLSTIILPDNNKSLEFGDYAFAKTTLTSMYPSNLTDKAGMIYLPDNTVKDMGQAVFFGNTSMTSVSLPASLDEIPDYTFDGCASLTSVEQRQKNGNSNVRLIGDCAFRGTAITDTQFMMKMNQLVQIGRQTHEKAAKITGLNARGREITSIDAGGEVKGMNNDLSDPSHKLINRAEVGSEVFTDCYNLTSVKIPASVQIIGNRAFYMKSANGKNPSLQNVEWASASGTPGTTRKIYPEAFLGNTALKTVVLPQNKGEALEIGTAAFCDNHKLTSIGAANVKNNTLPNTVSVIGVAAFYKCKSLKEIHIQAYNNTMPTLNPRVFEYCWSLKTASLPPQTTEIPYHFFAACPLTSFNFDQMTNLVTIDTLAFVGHQFATVDLSNCTKLEELGAGSLAFSDSIVKNYGTDDRNSIAINPDEKIKTDELPRTSPVLTTVIMPASVASEGVYIDSAVFESQSLFNTLYRKGKSSANTVVIPYYVVPGTSTQMSESQGIFRLSGVSKVIWEADTNPAYAANQWKSIANGVYGGCANIKDAKDVLPKYVEKIGQSVFLASSIESANLSGFSNLTEISTNIGTNQTNSGAFQLCPELTTVTLPSSVSDGITLNAKTFMNSTALKTVNLGATKTIGNSAFAECTALKTVDLGATKTIGNSAFAGCTGLQNMHLKNVVDINQSAFSKCTNLASLQFGNALETIGVSAFDSCLMLSMKGTPLPNTLKSIGASAFANSGLAELDFSKAKSLDTIGAGAFQNTQLTEFDISGTQVKIIPSTMLYDCEKLTKATFGEEVERIEANAVAGCPNFKDISFYPTTTVDVKVFYEEGKNTKACTGQKNSTTVNNSITINVKVIEPEEEVIVPIGRETEFPYYINKQGTSRIQYLSIIDKAAPQDLTVEEYLFVRSNANGYYKVQNSDAENGTYKVNTKYYEKLTKAETVNYSKQQVDVIKVTGLKDSANRKLEFNIFADIQFECKSKEYSIKSSTFNAKYNVKVLDPQTTVNLYSDNKKEILIPNTTTNTIQAVDNKKGVSQCYYDIVDMVDTGSEPDCYNIVVETSNPQVIYAGNIANAPSYATKVTTENANGTKRTNKNGMNFRLNPVGVGTATLTVYPADVEGVKKEKGKKVYTFNVNSDISKISLGVPKGYPSQQEVGAVFSVFNGCTNYFGQTCSDITQLANYTNRTITFESNAPDYVSVDQLGNVSILKADAKQKKVTITATSVGTNDRKVTGTVYVTVKPVQSGDNNNKDNNNKDNNKNKMPAKNEAVTDKTTGSMVMVVTPSTKDLEGEVTYTGPVDKNATSVTIPDTITINGVKYKVTTIAAKAFKNNKKVKTVKIGNYVKTIDKEAFSGCTALTKVTIGNAVEKINTKAFYNCKKLKTVTISSKSSLKTIGSNAFAKCVKLTKITIPSKVKTIGTKAFYNCKKLKKITIKSSVLSSVGKNAFKGIHKKATIKVPKKKLSAYKKLLKGKGQKSTVKIKK